MGCLGDPRTTDARLLSSLPIDGVTLASIKAISIERGRI